MNRASERLGEKPDAQPLAVVRQRGPQVVNQRLRDHGVQVALGDRHHGDGPRYRDPVAMGRDYPDAVDERAAPLPQQRTRAELGRLAREQGFPWRPSTRWAKCWPSRSSTSGASFRRSATRASPPACPAAEPGPLPLSGLRVLDWAWVWSGSLVSEALATIGADVIKVEHGDRLDNSRL